MILTGTLLGVSDRQREYNGERWTERVAHILDGMVTVQVTLQRGSDTRRAFDESKLPAEQSPVALEVYGRGAANKRVYLTGVRSLSESDVAEALGLLSV